MNLAKTTPKARGSLGHEMLRVLAASVRERAFRAA